MAIYKGDKKLKLFKGDYGPVNLYKGDVKIAGYNYLEETGTSLNVANTYNDSGEIEIKGKTVQLSDWYVANGLSSQIGTPSPTNPIEITHSIPAGTYQIPTDYGIYEVTLDEALRGINGVFDSVELDKVSGKGWLRKRYGEKIFDGSEGWLNYTALTHETIHFGTKVNRSKTSQIDSIICDRFKYVMMYNQTQNSISGYNGLEVNEDLFIDVRKELLDITDFSDRNQNISSVKRFFVNNPTTVEFVLATPTRTPLTFTKVTTSSAPTLPMEFLTNVPSADYYADVHSVEGNLVSRTPNLIENGNFADGTNGWWGVSANISVSSNELQLLRSAVSSRLNIYPPPSITLNNKYYLSSLVKSTSNNVMQYTTNPVITGNKHTGSGNYELLSVVFQPIGTPELRIAFSGTIQTDYVKNVMLINLTQEFGAGNEPTKAQCDILFSKWMDKKTQTIPLPPLKAINATEDAYMLPSGRLDKRTEKEILQSGTSWSLPNAKPNSLAISTHLGNVYLDGTTLTSATTIMEEHQVIYELVEPVITYIPQTVNTYYPNTIIEQDGIVKGDMTGKFKVAED